LAELQQTAANTKADNSGTDTKIIYKRKQCAGNWYDGNIKLIVYTNIFESTTEEANISINFENSRGRLPWPADQGLWGLQHIFGTLYCAWYKIKMAICLVWKLLCLLALT
jgi:hypothetical protein